MALMMETDPSTIINELIYAVRKGGRIGVVGIYAGFCNRELADFIANSCTVFASGCYIPALQS